MSKLLFILGDAHVGRNTGQNIAKKLNEEHEIRDFLKEDSLANTSEEHLSEITFIGHADKEQYQDFDAQQFVKKFAADFKKVAQDADKDKVKTIRLIGCEIGCKTPGPALAQQIADALYDQGFKNITVQALATPDNAPYNAGMRFMEEWTLNDKKEVSQVDYSAFYFNEENRQLIESIEIQEGNLCEKNGPVVSKMNQIIRDNPSNYTENKEYQELNKQAVAIWEELFALQKAKKDQSTVIFDSKKNQILSDALAQSGNQFIPKQRLQAQYDNHGYMKRAHLIETPSVKKEYPPELEKALKEITTRIIDLEKESKFLGVFSPKIKKIKIGELNELREKVLHSYNVTGEDWRKHITDALQNKKLSAGILTNPEKTRTYIAKSQ